VSRSKQGVLLINLGTPADCKPRDVGKYLQEFLMDPRVIDIRGFERWVLTRLLIIPFRKKKSARAYAKIWRKEGAPLLYYSERLCQALTEELGGAYHVEFGMRYGQPSIAGALQKLKSCASLQILPLFPQYSSVATGSVITKVLDYLRQQRVIPSLQIHSDFFVDGEFIAAYSELIKENLQEKNFEKLIFSYHGLPQRHITKSCAVACEGVLPCPTVSTHNRYCYRAQCYATSQALAKALALQPSQYIVSFQSRLGKMPWIKPYTDELLIQLRAQGVNDIAIACPSFVADCLETLEEIDIRGRAQWQALGGQGFVLLPCLNDDKRWVKALAGLVEERC